MCPLGRLVGPAGLPGVGSLWALLRLRCEVDVDESLVEGAAGGGAGRQGSPGIPVEWQVSRVGGLGNKGSCCPGRILSLSAFVTVSLRVATRGKDWNPGIPLVKCIFLVPDHIWPKTIKGQPALTHVIRNYVLLLVVPPLCLWWVTHTVTKALRLKILPGQQLPLFPNPPTLLTCHSTGIPGEPYLPAPPPAAPSTRDSSTSTSHRRRSNAHKLPTPGRPAGPTSLPNGHTTWW